MIEARQIKKWFGDLNVLKGIDLHIKEKEIVSIVGASGAGKTTLLQIIGTLDKSNEGDLYINNTQIAKLSDKMLSEFRNKNIGFVFQFHHLLPEFTALENICIPAWIAGMSKKEAERKAYELLDLLKLRERAHHKPSEMSGGEQQRIAVARALVNNPKVILADEPSGNLDSHNRTELHQMFFDIRDKFGTTFVIITHDNELAEMADRKITIRDGIIID